MITKLLINTDASVSAGLSKTTTVNTNYVVCQSWNSSGAGTITWISKLGIPRKGASLIGS
jgi:hypothetical protein